MKTLLLLAALAIPALGCKSEQPKPGAAEQKSAVVEVSIEELDNLIAKGACTPIDANGETTRTKVGIIPGAVLLSDYESYAATELPADKKRALVFYCANEECGASHKAAAKALLAGYDDVRVMPAGILGWQKAGKQLKTL